MCGTCGCGENTDVITLTLVNNSKNNADSVNHEHLHEHTHIHKDGHSHTHSHSHTIENHSHNHDHMHKRVIEVEKDILMQNDLMAERNRGYFEARNITAINLVSSPGSGKTSLLESTLAKLKNEIAFSVIEGDQQTLNDANRIAAHEVPVVQINTGKACHLDSEMVNKAVKKLNPPMNSILFIENVGNLVCPAMFDLGEAKRVVIISVTEGDDKAIKYPDMFHSADLCVINKIDLLPYVNFDVKKAKEYALKVNHKLQFMEVSAVKGTGMEDWKKWLSNIKQPVLHD